MASFALASTTRIVFGVGAVSQVAPAASPIKPRALPVNEAPSWPLRATSHACLKSYLGRTRRIFLTRPHLEFLGGRGAV